MAKIRKIYDQTIKPDGSKTTIYPITSTRAVFAPDGTRLDEVLANLHVDLPYIALDSTFDLPPEENHNGYLIGENLYVWVGAGGDTLGGRYKNCGPFRGPRGTSLQPDNEDIRETEANTLQFADRDNVEGMGYKILRRNKSFKQQIDANLEGTANTIYEIRYDFDLDEEEVTIPENCVLKFEGGSLSNGSIEINNVEVSGTPILGVWIAGTIKNEAVFQSWFDTIDRYIYFVSNTSGYSELNLSPGIFYPTLRADIKVEHALTIHGNGCKLVYDYADTGGVTVLLIEPKESSTSEYIISDAIDKNMMTFSVSDTTGLNVGDTVAIRDISHSSFSWYRDYQKGEFAVVTKISGNTITINRNLSDSYVNTSNLRLYKFNLIYVTIDNLKITQSSVQDYASNGIRIVQASAKVSNVEVSGFEVCIYAKNNFNSTFTDCSGLTADLVPSNNRVSYGMMIGNSQGVKVFGGTYKGKNHGISIGGSYELPLDIVNRFIIIDGVNAANVEDGFLGSIESHGDAQYCTFRNNWCNGIYFSGKNFLIENNHMHFLGGAELANYNHEIKNNVIDGYFYIAMTKMLVNADDTPKYANSTYDNFVRETEPNVLSIQNNVIRNISNPYYESSDCEIRYDVPDTVFDALLLTVLFKNNTIMNQKLLFRLFYINGTTAPENHPYSDYQKSARLIVENNSISYQGSINTYHIFGAKTVEFINNRIDDILGYSITCCTCSLQKNILKLPTLASFAFRFTGGEVFNIYNNVIDTNHPFSVTVAVSGNPTATLSFVNNSIEALGRLISLVGEKDYTLEIVDNRIINKIVDNTAIVYIGSNPGTLSGVIDNNKDIYRTNWPITSALSSLLIADGVSGNLAGFDSNGNLADSGYKPSDFEPAS